MSCNIMNEYVNFSKKCINKYIKKIMGRQFDQDVFNDLIKVYIDVRYNNLYEPTYKLFEINLCSNLRNAAIELMKESMEPKKIEDTFTFFKYILYFDNVRECESAKKIIKEMSNFREKRLGFSESENFINEFYEMLKEDLKKKKEFIERFDSKEFNVVYNKTDKNKVYDTKMEHSVKFPKIYSKYSIDKVYISKEITEQKLFVLYPLVTIKILTDVLKGDFKREYLVDFNINLLQKTKKIQRLFNMVDNDTVKEKLTIKIQYKDFINNKEKFYTYMRNGFKFAVILDETYILNAENIEILKVFKYILLNNKSLYYKEFKDLENAIVMR